jgi:hypothetical protein
MPTYTQIGSAVTVGAGGSTTIDFTSIPSTYTDLVIKASLRDTAAGSHLDGTVRFNDSTTGYTWRFIKGDGSSATSASGSTNTLYGWIQNGAGSTASTFTSVDIYIPNYAGSTYKSVSFDAGDEANATLAYLEMTAGLWSNTSAITKVSLRTDGTAFAQYSTAYLYGVSNA